LPSRAEEKEDKTEREE